MGGVPPPGYRAQDRKLVIIDSEAEIVRSILRRYAELGSVRLLKDELEARRIDSRSWTSPSGRLVGGKPFSRGALYLILQNRISRGSGSPEIKLHRRGRFAGIRQTMQGRRRAAVDGIGRRRLRQRDVRVLLRDPRMRRLTHEAVRTPH